MKRAWWREKSASEQAAFVARAVSHLALGVVALRTWVPSAPLTAAGSIGLGAATIALLLALALAARDANGVSRPLYAGITLATLGGVLSQVYNLVAYVLPAHREPLPNPSLWLLVA